ncbi:T9SS type B sorting domain-containing protein [Flavobacterium sp.]|uniref:T9SS type B sorting domain-containing protein n=1 Tax=Flavobacterium sp. TaxID=239 RepID=UPI00261820B7|nr:T9SS type B sorting domain-containing protein [Flavobacterium sp.]
MKSYLSVCLLFVIQLVFSQEGASSCGQLQANPDLYQSCATSIPFTNSVGNTSGESFNVSCIPSAFQGPTWFFLQIKQSGSITLEISQVSTNGIGSDVDFVIWGPFPNLTNFCPDLIISNEVDCSYAPAAIEEVQISNAVTGEYYILLVDNYANVPGEITISQIAGDGSSDCSFLSSVEIADINDQEITDLNYCNPETVNLYAKVETSDFDGQPQDLRFNFRWYLDNALISETLVSPSSENFITASTSGTYRIDLTAYDSTDPNIDVSSLPISSDEIVLTFRDAPQPVLSSSTVCLSDVPILTVQDIAPNSTTTLVNWYRNSNLIFGASGSTYLPTEPGIYTAGLSNDSCPIVLSNAIEILSQPQLNTFSAVSICENSSTNLTVVVGNLSAISNPTYQWFKDGIMIANAINPSLQVDNTLQTPGTTVLYEVEVSNNNQCISSTTANVTLNLLPTLATNVSLEQCDYIAPSTDGIAVSNLTEAAATLNQGNTQIVLRYFRDAALTDEITSPQTFTNNVPFNQTIYVTGSIPTQNPVCPSNVATISLQVNPTTVDTYPDMAPICPEINQNFGLANFEQRRQFIKSTYFPTVNVDIAFYSSATDASVETNPLDNTSQIPVGLNQIFARVESGNNCQGIATFNLLVNTPPQQGSIANVTKCNNDVFVLSSKDAEILAFQTQNVSINYYPSFAAAEANSSAFNKNANLALPIGTTDVFAGIRTQSNQCLAILPFQINNFDHPVLTAPSPIGVCGSTTANFDLTIRNNQITGGNPNLVVTYFASQADFNANVPITDPTAFITSSTTVIALVNDTANNNCPSQTTLELNVNLNPGATQNPEPLYICDDSGYADFNLTERLSAVLASTPNNEAIVRYYINQDDALAGNDTYIATPEAFRNTIQNTQTVYVRITSTVNSDTENNIPCFTVLELPLIVQAYPQNQLNSYPYKICVTETGTITREAFIDTGLAAADHLFQWYRGFDAIPANLILGANGPTFLTDEAGEYSVRATNITTPPLCSSVFNFTTRETLIPTSVSVTPEVLVAFEIDNTVTAIAAPQSNDYEYMLGNYGWQDSPTFENVREGLYTLTVRNKFGCGEVFTTVVVVDYQKFFTPNGDGINDVWNLQGRTGLRFNNIFIFDRHGKLIRELSENQTGWDGTYNGAPLPADDYWFKAEYATQNTRGTFSGHFTLKR